MRCAGWNLPHWVPAGAGVWKIFHCVGGGAEVREREGERRERGCAVDVTEEERG